MGRAGWAVPILVDGRSVRVSGQLRRVPTPSLSPWLLVVFGAISIGGLAAAGRRPSRVSTACFVLGGVGAVAGIVVAAGFAFEATAPGMRVAAISEFLLAAGGVGFAVWGPHEVRVVAVGWLGLLALFGGLACGQVFLHGAVLSALPPTLTRTALRSRSGRGPPPRCSQGCSMRRRRRDPDGEVRFGPCACPASVRQCRRAAISAPSGGGVRRAPAALHARLRLACECGARRAGPLVPELARAVVVLALGVAAALFVRRAAHVLRGQRRARLPPLPGALWLARGPVSSHLRRRRSRSRRCSRRGIRRVGGVFGHGGWWAVPVAAVVALGVSALLRAGRAVLLAAASGPRVPARRLALSRPGRRRRRDSAPLARRRRPRAARSTPVRTESRGAVPRERSFG